MNYFPRVITFCYFLFSSFLFFGQNDQFDESTCQLIDNHDNHQAHYSSNSEQNNSNSQQNRTIITDQSSTHVRSYLKAYGVDAWIINKSSNHSITIESYPANVGTYQQSYNTIGQARMNIIKPDGTYLIQNHNNHNFNNAQQVMEEYFFQIPADSPNGEYKIEMANYLNDQGGYSLKALSNNSYMTITADTSIPTPITETHVFNETTATEWEITKSESFSVGNDVHEWSLPLLEGENLVIDLYNVAPFVCIVPDIPFWDSMDTILYLLDANNNVVASNDDGGNNKNARIYYTVPSAGDYKIIASNYGRFNGDTGNWSVNLEYQFGAGTAGEEVPWGPAGNDWGIDHQAWGLGTTGITYYDLKIKSSSTVDFTTEDFPLTNSDAIKINAILLTDDVNLVNLPVTTNHIESLITDLNTEYNKVYNSSYWPGFELAVITKFYAPDYSSTSNPHNVLSAIGNGPTAKQNHINIIFTEIDNDNTNIVASTYLYSNVTSTTGASILMDDFSADSAILIHEMGHVTGMNHIAGTWPPRVHSLNLENGTSMGYTTNYISRPENSFMSTWNSYPFSEGTYTSNYLTLQPPTLKTTSYGDHFSEAFRSWLIINNYISSDTLGTGYEGNDTSNSTSESWVNKETITAGSSVFSSIASSKSDDNNSAAYVFQKSDQTNLYYGFRKTDNTWAHSSLTTDTGRNRVEMNSNGDAIIIVEPWRNSQLTSIYKAHDQNDWSTPEIVANSEWYSVRSNFQINNNGNVALVWMDIGANSKLIKFKELVNGSWANETTLSNSTNIKELPSIAYNDNRDVLVTWQEWDINSSGRFDVVGKFKNGSTQAWGDLETFSDATNHAGFSQVAMDSSGDALIYWRQATGTFVSEEANNPVGELNVKYRNYDGSLENTVTISPTGEDSFNASTESTEPRVVFENGHAAVTWWGVNGGHNIIYASIMQDKITWNTTALTTNGKNADLSSISIGNNGFVAVAWQKTDGLNHRIQSKFYNSSTSSWSSVMTMSDQGADAIHSDIAVDGNSSATASWVRWNTLDSKYIPEIKQYTPIIITLSGSETITLEVGTNYEEAGATAINSSGVDVSGDIQIYGTVDSSVVGTYNITYDVTDSTGNIALTKTRVVNVVDTTLPIISLLGDNSITIEVGSSYDDAGATASDNYDGDITSSIIVNSTVNTSLAESYTVTYNVTDANGNAATTATRIVKVEHPCISSESFETFPPSDWIIINSDVSINDIELSDGWSDDGTYSLMFSTYYGSPTQNQYIISPQLVTTETDRYMKFYPYAWSSQQIYRVGWSSTGTDIDNDFTWGEVQTAYDETPLFEKTDLPVGTKYIIIEHIFDTYGGKMYVDSFCLPKLYVDDESPVITSGSLGIDLFENSGEGQTVYTTIATDNIAVISYSLSGTDASLLSITSSGVVRLTTNPDYETKSSYSFTVTASDAAGNTSAATTVTFSITDVDDTAPVITVTGDNPATVELGATYTDAGATASDGLSAPGSGFEEGLEVITVTSTSNVDISAVGSYTVTYSATDAAGNAATQVTRTVNVVDTTAPVITVTSANPATVELGASYTDAGATATDLSGAITVTSTSTVDTSTVGSYTVTYSATDAAGNAATQVTRTVNVVDTTAPVITVTSANPATVELGASYTDAGATATDLSGAITVTSAGTVNTSVVGTYSVTYTSTDASNNTGTVTRTINVVDTTAPVITITGDNPVTVELGASYTDAGATASDLSGTNLVIAVTSTSTVDTSAVGSYTVTYSATDASNNTGTATRAVNVVDTTAPVITVTSANPATVELGASYTDAGATATDLSGAITVTSTSTVDTSTVGSYTVTYSATDAAGNAATQVTRTVNVVDTTAPVITVTSANPATVELGASYTDAGATATDLSGAITVTSTSTVDTSTVGSYTVTYSATDAAGNAATQVTRTVNVVDTTVPVIVVTGDNPATVELGASYTDAGATATDLSGAITVTSTSTVDTSAVGSYTVTYTSTDASNNTGTATRSVNVVDTTAPILTQVTAIETPSNNRNPSYIFTTSEQGVISSSLAFTSETNTTTANNQMITFSELEDGLYTQVILNVTDASGNLGTLIIPDFVIDETASSGEGLDFASIVIYPNPAFNKLFIDTGKIFDYELYNVLGQKIIFGKIREGTNEINISKYSNGIYILKFRNGYKSFSKKIVINQ